MFYKSRESAFTQSMKHTITYRIKKRSLSTSTEHITKICDVSWQVDFISLSLSSLPQRKLFETGCKVSGWNGTRLPWNRSADGSSVIFIPHFDGRNGIGCHIVERLPLDSDSLRGNQSFTVYGLHSSRDDTVMSEIRVMSRSTSTMFILARSFVTLCLFALV